MRIFVTARTLVQTKKVCFNQPAESAQSAIGKYPQMEWNIRYEKYRGKYAGLFRKILRTIYDKKYSL